MCLLYLQMGIDTEKEMRKKWGEETIFFICYINIYIYIEVYIYIVPLLSHFSCARISLQIMGK